MILLHRFKEKMAASGKVLAGTATCTRAQSESSDRDPHLFAQTKTATAIRHESPDTDHSVDHSNFFPHLRDSHSHKQG